MMEIPNIPQHKRINRYIMECKFFSDNTDKVLPNVN